MTGAGIFTCDGTKIAGAWGQDPPMHPYDAPGIRRRLHADPVDLDAARQDRRPRRPTPTVTAGSGPDDTIRYEVVDRQRRCAAVRQPEDHRRRPARHDLRPGLDRPSRQAGTATSIPDDGPAAATPYPFDEDGTHRAARSTPGQTGRIRYKVKIDNPFPHTAGHVDHQPGQGRRARRGRRGQGHDPARHRRPVARQGPGRPRAHVSRRERHLPGGAEQRRARHRRRTSS